MFEAVYPLIAPEPDPEFVAGTVFEFVNAYALDAAMPATSAAKANRRRFRPGYRISGMRFGSSA